MTDEPRCEPPPEWRDRDGWHWVERDAPAAALVAVLWSARYAWWGFRGGTQYADMASREGWRYLAPVTPPATVAALVEALEECANDLEAYVMRQYSGDVLTPGNALRRARDLAPVDAARAALAAYREAGR